jgi:N4-gp56 family major capsid protein
MAAPLMTTQSASLSAEVRQAYDKRLLHTAEPELLITQFFEKKPIPRGEGSVINMNRVELLAPPNAGGVVTPLAEGIPPNGSNITVTRVPITINQYGDFVPFSDRVLTESIDPLLAAIVDRQGEQAGRTGEWLSRDVISAGTVVRYANGRVSRVTIAAGDNLTAVEIKKAVRTLKKNFARKRTQKGRKAYIAIISPDTEFDVQSINEWLAIGEYQKADAIFEGEIGMLYGVRFIVSTEAKLFAAAGAAGVDVHASIFFGMEAFGCSAVDGESLVTINQPLGSAGTLDPLKQVGSQGWKMTWGGTILNQLFALRVEHAVTA